MSRRPAHLPPSLPPGLLPTFLAAGTAKAQGRTAFCFVDRLYAIYRRWCWRTSRRPLDAQAFAEELRRELGEPEVVDSGGRRVVYRGLVLKPWEPAVAGGARVRAASPRVVRGRVVVKADQTFVDCAIRAGAVLDWLAPTKAEAEAMKRDDAAGRPASMVVEHAGRRRLLPSSEADLVVGSGSR